jgi:hypothetical protein
MMRTVIDLSPPTKPDLWRRFLAFILDGMSNTNHPAAPVEGLTREEFEIFIASKKRAVK